LLWAARGDVFAAVAPCAAAAKPEFKSHLTPKPVLHVAGKNDPLVRFSWQERTIAEVRKINGCGEGNPWGEHCTLYPSKGGTPVVTYIHSGGHLLPDEASPVIVKFFKKQVKP
jgi:polyhydroxybutyrate depolymerase